MATSDIELVEKISAPRSSDAYRSFCRRFYSDKQKSANVLMNRIYMFRQNPKNASICAVIVEGITDARFYQKFVEKKHCYLFIGCTKKVVEDAIKLVNAGKKGNRGTLGIIDLDFDSILAPANQGLANLLHLETHDIETLIFQSDALDQFSIEYGNSSAIENFLSLTRKHHIKEVLVETGFQIGLLRLYAAKTFNKGVQDLTFKDIKLADFIDPKTLKIDFPSYLKKVIQNSPNNKISESKLLADIDQLKSQQNDLWVVCQGHDLITIFLVGLKRIFGNANAKLLTSGMLQSLLRLAYHPSLFQKTQLYAQIRAWEKINSPFLILPP